MDNLRGKARRRFLQLAAATVVGSLLTPAAEAARRLPGKRTLAFHNLHTGESLDTVYWSDGHYVPDAMRRINWLLRDYRAGEVHRIDPRLLDLLVNLRHGLHTNEPIQIISGYRSPSTNAMLASMSDGVAQHSLHMQGMAVDIRVPGRRLKAVHTAALRLGAGGVGYYPHSDFVHVDVGPIRRW